MLRRVLASGALRIEIFAISSGGHFSSFASCIMTLQKHHSLVEIHSQRRVIRPGDKDCGICLGVLRQRFSLDHHFF